jgi:hypothetical protein
MNAAAPPLSMAEAELNDRYIRLLGHCDAEAMRSKRRLFTLWGVSMGLTWVPLILAIFALSGWLPTIACSWAR